MRAFWPAHDQLLQQGLVLAEMLLCLRTPPVLALCVRQIVEAFRQVKQVGGSVGELGHQPPANLRRAPGRLSPHRQGPAPAPG